MVATITRRGFLGRSAAAAGALAAAVFPRGARAAQSPVPVYRLDPEWGSCGLPEESKPLSCHACAACHGHAHNKLFASAAAADANRAHLHCKCLVEPAGTLPYGTWAALFGNPRDPGRVEVDRRHPKVAAILGHRLT
jgi:hypothetical protein